MTGCAREPNGHVAFESSVAADPAWPLPIQHRVGGCHCATTPKYVLAWSVSVVCMKNGRNVVPRDVSPYSQRRAHFMNLASKGTASAVPLRAP